MALGVPSKTTANALAHLTQAIFGLHADQLKDHALFQQAIHLLAAIEDNRNERLDSADGSVPPILWFVLMVGALITLGYPAFFGTSNLVAQALMTATLAALVALSLVPILVLDFPFTGQVALKSNAFRCTMRASSRAFARCADSRAAREFDRWLASPLLSPLLFDLPGFRVLTLAKVAGQRGSGKYLHTNSTIAFEAQSHIRDSGTVPF